MLALATRLGRVVGFWDWVLLASLAMAVRELDVVQAFVFRE